MLYSDLTDEQLATKINELRQNVELVMSGQAVEVMAGEGRRLEYTRGNVEGLERMLASAIAERDKRSNGGRIPGRAIRVRHHY